MLQQMEDAHTDSTPPVPAVSVIIPCYKVTAFIAEALDSARAQTFRDFETIVINDGCPDTGNLERALAPYQDEIRYIKQENQGLAGALNTAIRAARAPLIAFLSGDDIWEPNYLEVQVGYLEKHPEVDVVYPNAVYFGVPRWAGKIYRDVSPSRGEVTVNSLLTGECIVNAMLAARREAIMKVGMFDPELSSGEDWDLWLRVAKAGFKIAYHNQVLYRYRLRLGSLSDDKLGLSKSGIGILEKFLRREDLTSDERRLALERLRDYEAQLSLALGKIALYAGNRKDALFHLGRANAVMKDRRIGAALLLLRVAPWALYRLVHRRYATEYQFLH
jgi:glycosyltransferase involved in cell wall biosynthesis